MSNLPLTLSLGLAALAASVAVSPDARGDATPPADVAALRAQGPVALDRLLARYDALPAGPAKVALEATIDRVAAQRYATVSHLYWYTDLDAAKAAARAQHRPILALRMLGRLDEDLSCANSRLFRATLYANADVSRFLRANFVLYWSSERAVPKVTIDLGDGRSISGTTTGNSAHYVLDADGRVLDVLPGLYAPVAFRGELAKSLALAAKVDALGEAGKQVPVSTYHHDAFAALDTTWKQLPLTYVPGSTGLLARSPEDTRLAVAQRATISKAYIEVPQLRTITAGTDPGVLDERDTALWATLGQRTWRIGAWTVPAPPARPLATDAQGRVVDADGKLATLMREPRPAGPLPRVLDDRSLALITRLHDAGPLHADAFARMRMIERLEQHVVADSAQNQFRLRRQIHQFLEMNPRIDFATVNRWVYDTVFATPAGDPWMGLLPRTEFTGLPGDGAVAPAPRS